MFLISYTHARQYERDIAALRDQERGPEYYFKAAFYHTKEADKKAKPTKKMLDLRKYPTNPDDPGAEIRNAHKRLKDTQTALLGLNEDIYAEPHPADQILAEVLKTIQSAKPSYDFALLRLDLLESGVTIEYLASLTETQSERDRLGAGTLKESERMIAAFREMASQHPEWFDPKRLPEQSAGGRPQVGPEGREADLMTLKMYLKKIEPPKKKKATSSKEKK
jgi:hypothetical protein